MHNESLKMRKNILKLLIIGFTSQIEKRKIDFSTKYFYSKLN